MKIYKKGIGEMQIYFGYKILNKLLENDKVLAKDLAEELETSTRTIYRYVNALANCGAPINSIIGRNGGIEIDKSFKINKTFFNNAELVLIKTSLAPLSINGNTVASAILDKLNLM